MLFLHYALLSDNDNSDDDDNGDNGDNGVPARLLLLYLS